MRHAVNIAVLSDPEIARAKIGSAPARNENAGRYCRRPVGPPRPGIPSDPRDRVANYAGVLIQADRTCGVISARLPDDNLRAVRPPVRLAICPRFSVSTVSTTKLARALLASR